MLDMEQLNHLRSVLADRFTAEELCEILGLKPEDIIDRFTEEVMGTDWDEHL